MVRYVMAGVVSAILGLVDLPPGQIGGLLSWRKRTSAWIAPLYLAVTAAAGVAAVALASVGTTGSARHPALSGVLLGIAGHGCMRATVRGRGRSKATDQAQVASALERTRGWLEELLRTKAAGEVLPALREVSDPELLELAADLASPALETPSAARRKELGILLAAAESLATATSGADEPARRALRTALRAEIVKQGLPRSRVVGAQKQGSRLGIGRRR